MTGVQKYTKFLSDPFAGHFDRFSKFGTENHGGTEKWLHLCTDPASGPDGSHKNNPSNADRHPLHLTIRHR